jgi:lysophospholipase L1-like esterase
VVITGTNLSGATSVTFGGTAATITNNTATTITVTTPAHAAGAVNVVANVSAGTATSTGGYTYLSAPAITNINPTSGPTGTSVIITGNNFGATQGTSTVKFNGITATSTSWSATSITAPVPAGATTGAVVVTVGGIASNGVTFTVTSGSGNLISKSNWTLLFVDSQDVLGGNYAATNSFDGNVNTMWATRWFNINPPPPPPHEIQINLGAVHNVSGFRYLPRQDGSQSGRIGQYEFYVSLDGVSWGSPVAVGTFANNALEKEVSFVPAPGQYVRLRALTEVNGDPWTTMAELNVLEIPCITPSVNLIKPQSYYLQPSPSLYVSALACLNSGQGVRFVLDGGSAAFDDFTQPYEVIFSGLTQSEHVIDAFVIDSAGAPVPGAATHDQAIQVGIGDYDAAMGDSITTGVRDDVPSDDNSQDGRNTGGGYTPILNDLLTGATGRPHTVVDEGVPGAISADGLSLIPTLLQKHPNAQRFLIMYGTNDTGIPVPSGLGLQPGNPGYPGSFKDNMQRIIDAIKGAEKVAILAKAPVALPLNGQRDTIVQQYNLVIDELVTANNIPVTPPDFHAYFATHYTTEYGDELHPNGIGYQSMANLWFQALTQ